MAEKRIKYKIMSNLKLLLLAPFVLLVMVGVYVYIDISLMKSTPAFTRESEIVKARNAAKREVPKYFKQIEEVGAFQPGDTSSADKCFSGQNNSKVFQGYAWRCGYVMTKLYGFNGDFKESMLELHNVLARKVNYADDNSIPDRIKNYYDMRHWKVAPAGRSGDDHTVSDMPDMHLYTRDGQYFLLNAFEQKTKYYQYDSYDHQQGAVGYSSGLENVYIEREQYDTERAVKKMLDKHDYVIQAYIYDIYWERPFPDKYRSIVF